MNVLVLGLGLGGIPLLLAKYPNIKNIDVIDLDFELFRIFKSIVTNPSPNINLIYGDANIYLKQNYNKGIEKIKYDIIFDDLFIDNDKVFIDLKYIYKNLIKNGYYFSNIHKREQVLDIIKKIKSKKYGKFNYVKFIKNNEHLLILNK